jgi:hypothetical protein
MREWFWKVGDWIAALPCRRGFHDWEAWQPNTFAGRVWFDWTRECLRCQHMEHMPIGENPSGFVHPGRPPARATCVD